ncbi:MAG: hypothetical protein ACFFCO_02150 [Promethearchaeota archaeon]
MRASKEIPTAELSPSLAFGAAYYSISSIRTRLISITETFTKEGFIGKATFSSPIPDSDAHLEVVLEVDSSAPQLKLEISGVEEAKLKIYLDEIARRITETLDRFSQVSGVTLSKASKAVIVERKLDEAIDQLFDNADFQKVYVIVADARERLIRLGGFDPLTLQMGSALTPLAGRTGKIPKAEYEELALHLLRWKKSIKTLIESVINSQEED